MQDISSIRTTAIIMIVVGFISGIIWGVIGLVNYFPMKAALEAGDYGTAMEKYKVIKVVTIVGIVVNLVFIFGRNLV